MLPRNLTRRVLAPKSTNQTQQPLPQNNFQQEQQRSGDGLTNSNNNNNGNIVSLSNNVNGGSGEAKQRDASGKLAASTTSALTVSSASTQNSMFRAPTQMEMSSDRVNIQQTMNRRPPQNYYGSNDVYNQNVSVLCFIGNCKQKPFKKMLTGLDRKRLVTRNQWIVIEMDKPRSFVKYDSFPNLVNFLLLQCRCSWPRPLAATKQRNDCCVLWAGSARRWPVKDRWRQRRLLRQHTVAIIILARITYPRHRYSQNNINNKTTMMTSPSWGRTTMRNCENFLIWNIISNIRSASGLATKLHLCR